MALSYVMLVLGMSMIGWATCYALWSHARVVFLRQNLFAIRDRLWDRALELDAFEDPAYQQARRHLNSMIGVAGTLSMQTLEIISKVDLPRSPEIATRNSALQIAIDEARLEAADTVITYLLFRTASGIFFVIKQILLSSYSATREKMDLSRSWLMSSSPDAFALSSGQVCYAHARK